MGTLKRFNLEAINRSFGANVLVETGTYKGDSVKYAISHGLETIHSIEIDPSLYIENCYKFSMFENVFIHYGSSHEIIPSLLPHIVPPERPIIFWLDAHFPFADSGKKSYNFENDSLRRMPILSEIESIASIRPLKNDVIIVDDLRCFVDDERIPADRFDIHMMKLGQRGYGCTRQNIVGVEISDLIKELGPSYRADYLMLDEGYAIFSPIDSKIELKVIITGN